MQCKCTGTVYRGVEDGMAGTGSLITGDAVFSEQITNMKDLSCFNWEIEAPVQVSRPLFEQLDFHCIIIPEVH